MESLPTKFCDGFTVHTFFYPDGLEHYSYLITSNLEAVLVDPVIISQEIE
jgi:hypothetical protein